MIAVELPGAHVRFTAREDGDLRDPGLRTALGAQLEVEVRCARQVHGAAVATDGALLEEADGQATVSPTTGVAVLVADCLPVAVAGDGGVAMLHGGWRGLHAGVLEQGVGAVRALGVSGPLHAAIGPGAGACCYEVGADVHAAFGTSGRTVDLKAIARLRLRAAGVDVVQDVGVCTLCDERYFSFRREGDAAGRQAGIAWRS